MTVNRRNVLLGVLGATTFAAAVAGGAKVWLDAGYPDPGANPPLALSPKEWAVVKALVEAVLPGDEKLPPGQELGIHRRIDLEAWAMGPTLRAELQAVLQVLEHAPLLLGRPNRFSALVAPLRVELMADILDHGPDLAVDAVITCTRMVHLIAYGNPELWLFIGYDGPKLDLSKPDPGELAYKALRKGAMR